MPKSNEPEQNEVISKTKVDITELKKDDPNEYISYSVENTYEVDQDYLETFAAKFTEEAPKGRPIEEILKLPKSTTE